MSSASLNGKHVACYYEERGFAYVVLPRLGKEGYVLEFTTGATDMPTYVLNDGTYNVKAFQGTADHASVALEMYGTLPVKVKLLFEPHEVSSDNPDLQIKDWHYKTPFLIRQVRGRNIQGERGRVTIRR